MRNKCTICERSYGDLYAFKGGYVCEDCLQFLQAEFQVDSLVRSE